MLKLAIEEDREDIVRMSENFFKNSPFRMMTFNRAGIDAVLDLHLQDKSKAIVIIYSVDGKNVGMVAGVNSPPVFAEESIATEMAWWVDEEYRKTGDSAKLIYAFNDWAVRVGSYGTSLALIEGVSPPSVEKFYTKMGYHETEKNYLKVN